MPATKLFLILALENLMLKGSKLEGILLGCLRATATYLKKSRTIITFLQAVNRMLRLQLKKRD